MSDTALANAGFPAEPEAAPPEIPKALESQLADGGRLIVPVGGNDFQRLVLITREGDNFSRKNLLPVRFVPMVPGEKPAVGK